MKAERIFFSSPIIEKTDPRDVATRIRSNATELQLESHVVSGVLNALIKMAKAQGQVAQSSCSGTVTVNSEEDILAVYWLAKLQVLEFANNGGVRLEANGLTNNSNQVFGVVLASLDGAEEWGFAGLKVKGKGSGFFW